RSATTCSTSVVLPLPLEPTNPRTGRLRLMGSSEGDCATPQPKPGRHCKVSPIHNLYRLIDAVYQNFPWLAGRPSTGDQSSPDRTSSNAAAVGCNGSRSETTSPTV